MLIGAYPQLAEVMQVGCGYVLAARQQSGRTSVSARGGKSSAACLGLSLAWGYSRNR